MKNVIAYTRAGSSNHAARFVDQLECIREWIESQRLPWNIVAAYRDDSGGIVNAIGDIRRMLDERGIKATVIVAESLTRFGRDNKWPRSLLLNGFDLASVSDFVIPADL